MPRRPPADPNHFDAAVSWYRERLALTDQEWAELHARARGRARVAAEKSLLDLSVDLWRSLEKAITQGQSFGEWKRTLAEHLRGAWGAGDAARVETIFRQNVQTAYSAGRLDQLQAPAVLRARPYWMFDATLDLRTTLTCRALHGTILPADHPFWLHHYCPLHFRCRSCIRALTPAQAEARGITERPPAVQAEEGFGGDPRDLWRPDLRGTPEPLAHVYRQRQ
jgi:SPP1 gp7 family putative phage head morphogenesis protein